MFQVVRWQCFVPGAMTHEAMGLLLYYAGIRFEILMNPSGVPVYSFASCAPVPDSYPRTWLGDRTYFFQLRQRVRGLCSSHSDLVSSNFVLIACNHYD